MLLAGTVTPLLCPPSSRPHPHTLEVTAQQGHKQRRENMQPSYQLLLSLSSLPKLTLSITLQGKQGRMKRSPRMPLTVTMRSNLTTQAGASPSPLLRIRQRQLRQYYQPPPPPLPQLLLPRPSHH